MASKSRKECRAVFVLRGYAIFYRSHVERVTNDRYKVLQGLMRERISEIIRQTCEEM